MSEIRSKVRAIILGIVGFIVALLFFRVALDLIEASGDNFFISFINSISNFFIDPFSGVIEVSADSSIKNLNVDALLAMLIYILGGIAFSEIVTAFLYDDFKDILINFIDGIFKIVEFFIVIRIIFYFFGVRATEDDAVSNFVQAVYDLTEWTQFSGLNFDFLGDRMDWAAIIVLIFIVVFDVLMEGLINAIFERVFADRPPKPKKSSTVKLPPSPTPQNITVNVPAPSFTPAPQNQQPQPQQQTQQNQPPPQVNIYNPPQQQNPQPNAPQYSQVPQQPQGNGQNPNQGNNGSQNWMPDQNQDFNLPPQQWPPKQ